MSCHWNFYEKFNFCLTQLHSVFFSNIIKDLQCIYPPKICMKCYLLLHTACKRNSTISLKTYGNWRLQDNHLCRTCVRVIQLGKGALGKIKNTSRNYGRVLPSLSKLFCSEEDLDTLSAKYPPYNLPMYVCIHIHIYIYIYIYMCVYIYIYIACAISAITY